MLEAPRRTQRLSVALPASFTRDIPHLREKTSRIGQVARALAIFRVDNLLIYNDRPGTVLEREGRLSEKLLVYQETPQYLRRRLFATDPDLQFTGTLPPLRLASHPGPEDPREGLVREGLVIRTGPVSEVDAGLKSFVRVASRLRPLERVTVRLTRTTPKLEGEQVDPGRLRIYWGFRVTRTNSTLGKLVEREKSDLRISTSRRGRPVREIMDELGRQWRSSQRILVLFGSPSEGVPEILSREGIDVEKVADFNVNMIPDQGVETVRTEEALSATLAGLNLLEES